ncbi:MAG: L,D-transpeptidase family protein [Rubricella sp.]
MKPDDLVVSRFGARYRGHFLPVSVGFGGIGRKWAEGDGVTPAGRWRVVAWFCRPGRMQGGQPIGPGMGWSEAPEDPAYNRAVRLPHPWPVDRMARPDPLYDLVGVLDYNTDPTIPGAGSAIFLHQWRAPRRPTAGCIAFSRTALRFIRETWRPGARVIVQE